jgi:hypothetical protein
MEFVNYASGIHSGKGRHRSLDTGSAVMLRFYSLHHCIMAKHYFDARKGYEARSFYVRDYADRDVKALKWDTFPKVGESAMAKRKEVANAGTLEALVTQGSGYGLTGGGGLGKEVNGGASNF